jgi:hypothetical protein
MPTLPANSSQQQALFQATVEGAAAGGGALMGKLVESVVKALYERELKARNVYERDALIAAGKLMRSKEPELREAFPRALREVFFNPDVVKKRAPAALKEVHFDELELMDEGQVQNSVAVARVQQVTLLVADASLSELNTLICGLQGLKTVRPEGNPLRPESYVNSLKYVMERVNVSPEVRMEWMNGMSEALGAELNTLYKQLNTRLTEQGVVPVGYAMVQNAAGHGVGVPGSVSLDKHTAAPPMFGSNVGFGATGKPLRSAVQQRSRAPVVNLPDDDETLLTLDRLRRLLTGEFSQPAPISKIESFADQFSRQFEGGQVSVPSPASVPATSEFTGTVPAAFEALEEMQQVGLVVQRLKERQASSGSAHDMADSSVQGIREMLRQSATGVGQALSLEVVTLMVDNMARNPRLLAPIQRLIAELEPSLLLLSLVDQRFFTDKLHPARELLQEITHRSMAYESVDAPGFGGFLKQLQDAVLPLASASIESAEPFEQVLLGLRDTWDRIAKERELEREHAVQALQHAEQRNLLAEKIARQVESHADSKQVPDVVLDFLCGPWAQVVAQARIAGGAGSRQADKYQALISAMLWSAHPRLARKNIAKLTKLVPLLLATVRDGLETIRYPATKTSAFLEALMGLHQTAFRAAARAAKKAQAAGQVPVGGADPSVEKPADLELDLELDADEAADSTPEYEPTQHVRLHVVEDGNPWIAPEEARASNFLDFVDDAKSQAPAGAAQAFPVLPPVHGAEGAAEEMPLGSWFEVRTGGQWIRTQLTWASPHGTLFLFTSAFGASQSMTRRTREKLVAAGDMRVVSGQPVVDGALDAVAQIALRNSVDTKLGPME